MASESSKKNWRTGEGLTWKENLTRRVGVPAAALALAAGALTACSNTEAQPQPTPTSISTETPAPTETSEPSAEPTDTPTPGEFVGVPSGLEVDYDAFADWDDITSFTIPGGSSLEEDTYDLRFPGSKRSICYNFFRTNGLEINVKNGWEIDSNGEDLTTNGEEFVNSMVGRQNMILALAADDTDPRNLEVAHNLLECVTAPNSDSRQELTSIIEGIRDGSIEPQNMTLQSINKYVHEQNGNVFANYTLVSPDGDTATAQQLWTAVDSASGLYRSKNYTSETEE